MRIGVESWIRRVWRGEAGWPGRVASVALLPAELGWRAVTALRNRRWDRRAGTDRKGVSVVSVGNLAVGGTGKTPVTGWAVEVLEEAGRRPAVVARGYGRDEILLHRRWHPGVPVIADPDRVQGVETARAQGADTVVLDDGFQHRRLARDVDLVLLAAEDPLEGPLLPRGPFREPLSALERADALVVTRRTAGPGEAHRRATTLAARFPAAVVARLHLRPGGWTTLGGESTGAPAGRIVVATAVARPGSVQETAYAARGEGGRPELLAFPDHHDFSEADVRALRARAGDATLVVTEKDAVKLEPFAELLGSCRVLTLDLEWEEGEAPLRDLLIRTTRESP